MTLGLQLLAGLAIAGSMISLAAAVMPAPARAVARRKR
jgi:hypothetical protein